MCLARVIWQNKKIVSPFYLFLQENSFWNAIFAVSSRNYPHRGDPKKERIQPFIPGCIARWRNIDQSVRSPLKPGINPTFKGIVVQVRIFELKRAKMPFSAEIFPGNYIFTIFSIFKATLHTLKTTFHFFIFHLLTFHLISSNISSYEKKEV